MEMLECRNLTKIYGKKTVLKNVNLTFEKGKIYGLLGRNGAGKTTLLSVLSGQNPAGSGSVSWAGMPVWENEKALAHICFSRELGPGEGRGVSALKVKDYLRIASLYLSEWDAGMAKELTELFGLDVKSRIGKLSKGMQSMVSIIVAMASKADFTLMDEPAAGLDVVARQQLYRLIMEEHQETGRTFVISTHIIEEAQDAFDRVVFLKKGEVVLDEDSRVLAENCVHVRGMAEKVERAAASGRRFGQERFGRNMGVTLLLPPGERILPDADYSVQPVSLQDLFVAVCREEGEG